MEMSNKAIATRVGILLRSTFNCSTA